jgi:basic membrane protein A
MMAKLVEDVRAGKWKPSHVRGNLASGNAVLDPFGAAVPEAVRTKVLATKADIIAGKKVVWQGPIARQDGGGAVAAGQKMTLEQIETMDYLVKGVVGSAK